MKKTYLTALLAVTGLLLTGVSASAVTIQTEAGFSYQVLANGTATILNCRETCSATDLVIPATLGGVPVSKIAPRAFAGDGIKSLSGSLTLPATITEIGQAAFLKNSLTSITFPLKFVKVGTSAFSRNKLTTINVPSWMSAVPDEAFSYNPARSIVIPEGVKTIGSKSFYDSTRQVEVVVLPKSLTKLGVRAFGSEFRFDYINMIFLGKAPAFPKPAYSFISNRRGEEQKAVFRVGQANFATWKKFDPYEGCKKDCLFIDAVFRPDLLTVVPKKPKATWARLNLPPSPGSGSKKSRNVYVVQLSGNMEVVYLRASAPNRFKEEDPTSTLTFLLPPPGFAKINLKADPKRILTESSYKYFEYPDNSSIWSYFEFKAQRSGWLEGVTALDGEHLEGRITLEERRKLPLYYCKYSGPDLEDLSCKTKW